MYGQSKAAYNNLSVLRHKPSLCKAKTVITENTPPLPFLATCQKKKKKSQEK
jgi:hypothetical protein